MSFHSSISLQDKQPWTGRWGQAQKGNSKIISSWHSPCLLIVSHYQEIPPIIFRSQILCPFCPSPCPFSNFSLHFETLGSVTLVFSLRLAPTLLAPHPSSLLQYKWCLKTIWKALSLLFRNSCSESRSFLFQSSDLAQTHSSPHYYGLTAAFLWELCLAGERMWAELGEDMNKPTAPGWQLSPREPSPAGGSQA